MRVAPPPIDWTKILNDRANTPHPRPEVGPTIAPDVQKQIDDNQPAIHIHIDVPSNHQVYQPQHADKPQTSPGSGNLPQPTPQIVYRALGKGENPSHGLIARAPEAVDVTPLSHVAGKRQSPWISTTKLPSVAFDKYNQGNGVVAIDLSKIPGRVEDVSSGFPGKGRIDSYAKKDQEVLIFQFVPADAIVGYWQ